MKKPWKIPANSKLREWGWFHTHPCMDCFKLIRWEPYRCFDCDVVYRRKRAKANHVDFEEIRA